MRDFNFTDANTNAADVAGARTIPDLPEDIRREEIRDEMIARNEEPSLSSFHHVIEEDESNNTAKIAGAVLVGLLVVGGGIFAYESTLKSTTAPQAVAASGAPKQVAAATPAPMPTPAPATDATPAPSVPDASAPAGCFSRAARDGSGPDGRRTACCA
jgi:hypothetical protein